MKAVYLLFLCKTMIIITGIVCITWAAIAFNNFNLLWWYVILLFLGANKSEVVLAGVCAENEEERKNYDKE